jgi:hypothetical protein
MGTIAHRIAHTSVPPPSHVPSPPPRGRRLGDRCVIVEQVIKETSASVQYPTLTKTNYNEWSLLIRVNLQA